MQSATESNPSCQPSTLMNHDPSSREGAPLIAPASASDTDAVATRGEKGRGSIMCQTSSVGDNSGAPESSVRAAGPARETPVRSLTAEQPSIALRPCGRLARPHFSTLSHQRKAKS